MKSILTGLLLALSLSAFSQWEYVNEGTTFDGKMEYAAVVGTGDFPYSNPVIGIRRREGKGLELMFVSVNSSYSAESISFKFNNDDKIYTYSASHSEDYESWFLNEDEAVIKELALKMKSGLILYVRLSSENSHEDYAFTLRGSTAAIEKMKL